MPQVVQLGFIQATSQRSAKEISEFILSHNNEHQFDSASRFSINFHNHIRRLVEAGQVVEYTQDGKLVGVVGWIWTDSTATLDKGYWLTPKDVTQGKILYVSFAALNKGIKLYDWIRLLRNETIKRGTEAVHWGHYKRKTLKKRRLFTMSSNCGLTALAKIKETKGVSAFTLIHLAKDNGLELRLFKVKDSDLILVNRPAIFHSENHFEHIQNGEPLPDQKWSGYVLTQKSIGRPVSHNEAKTVTGEMPPLVAGATAIFSAISGAVAATATAVGIGTTAAGVIGTVGAGALVGAAGGAGLAAITGQPIGKGALGGAAIGAGAGAGSFFGGALGLSGVQTGSTLAGAASGALLNPEDRLGGALRGGTTGLLAGTGVDLIGNAAGAGAAMSLSGGGVGTAAGVPIAGGTGSGLAGATIGQQISGAFGGRPTEGFNLGSLGQAGAAGGIASIAKQFGPKGPDGGDFDPTSTFQTLRNTLGTQGLPPAAEADILNTVNTPLSELAQSFNVGNDRTIRKIEEAFDRQKENAIRQFGQAGQNFRTSSEARQVIGEIERDRAIALGEAEQEAFASALTEAIQSKQFALNRSIEANQFDVNLALELAGAIGQEEAFQQAIAQEDENQFNTLLAQILNIGFGGQDTQLSQIATSLRGTA